MNTVRLALCAFASLGTGAALAQPGDAAPREVKVTVAYHVRDFSRCVAHVLSEARPDLKHAAVSVGEGVYEVRSRQDATMVMVNHIRQIGREVTVSTRLRTASPPPEKWYEGVDRSIAECREESGEHRH